MAEPTFIDLDIRVLKGAPGMYLVTAQSPGSGVAQGTLDWAALDAADFKEKADSIRDDPGITDQELFRAVGDKLFGALFRGQIYDLFIALNVHKADHAETHLRMRLDIDEHAPEVATLPWEFMRYNDAYLAAEIDTLVTRQLLNLDYGAIKDLKIAGKPKVLVVIPRGSGLATDKEEARIRERLTAAGIPFKVIPEKDKGRQRVSLQNLDDELSASGPYHILHFIGHGKFQETDDGLMHGTLRFNAAYNEEDEKLDEEWVEDTRLRGTLTTYKDTLRLVVLNACEGAIIEQSASGHGFIGIAPAILKAKIPAVIAMQYPIRDDIAVQFGDTFYGRLTDGQWAGHVDIATTLARNACLNKDQRDRGFATPVLYLRSRNGMIFELDRAAPPPTSTPCPEPEQPSAPFQHRYDKADSLIASLKSLEGRLDLLQKQIDGLENQKLLNPFMATALDLQIEQLKAQRIQLEDGIEQKTQVLRWRLYETCTEQARLKAELDARIAQRADLIQNNKYVPNSLVREIGDLQKQVRDLDDVLQAGQRYR